MYHASSYKNYIYHFNILSHGEETKKCESHAEELDKLDLTYI